VDAPNPTPSHRGDPDPMNEAWEIDFSEIEFAPNGVPSSANRIGHGGFGEVFLGQYGGMPAGAYTRSRQSSTLATPGHIHELSWVTWWTDELKLS